MRPKFKRLWIGTLPEYITLWDYFFNVGFSENLVPWRIYGSCSRKLLCFNYCNELNDSDSLDDMRVVSSYRRGDYVVVYVDDKDVMI